MHCERSFFKKQKQKKNQINPSLAPYVLYVNCFDVVNQMPSGVLCSTVNRQANNQKWATPPVGKGESTAVFVCFCLFLFVYFLAFSETWRADVTFCQFGKAIKTSLANGFLFLNPLLFCCVSCISVSPSLEDGQLGRICSCVTNCPLFVL